MSKESITIQLYISLLFYIIFAFNTIRLVLLGSKANKRKEELYCFVLLLITIVIYCQGGDYWSYRLWFLDSGVRESDRHTEPIYRIIANILPPFFIFFRLAIWGAGLMIFKKICKKNNINIICAFSLFGVLYVEHYSYARASLAIVTAIYGFSMICDRHNCHNRKYYLSIISLIVLSCCFHKSVIGLWAILLCSLFLKFNTKNILLLIIFYKPIAELFNFTILKIMTDFIGQIGIEINMNYISGNFYERNTFGMIRIHLASIILFVYVLVQLRKREIPYFIERLTMASVFILYTASLFLSLRMGNSNTVAMRYFVMAYPPAIIVCAYAIQKGYINKKILITLLLWGAFYSSYQYYKNITDPTFIKYSEFRSKNVLTN